MQSCTASDDGYRVTFSSAVGETPEIAYALVTVRSNSASSRFNVQKSSETANGRPMELASAVETHCLISLRTHTV